MYFWILLVIIILLTVFFSLTIAEDTTETGVGFIIATFVSFILVGAMSAVVGLGLLAISFIPANRHADHSKDSTEILQAIQMGDGVEGRFFLGSGYISDENVYTYYAKISDGSYYSGRIDADSAIIIESDTETPRIITHHYYWSRWIMPHFVNDGLDFGGETYTVYVPKGSVKPMVDMSLPK